MFQHRPHHDILQLFEDAKLQHPGFLTVSAPMVRYSKFEFRQLLRLNGVKLTFTPMIIADSFNNSQKARDNEFTTTNDDQPLIGQFAAANAEEFATSAELIYPYVDGVDLNCGCPQSWAISKNYGCGLLRQPEIVRDIVQTTRRRLPQNFSISVKFRLITSSDKTADAIVRNTVDMARKLEHCGVSFLTLHGRTMWQSTADAVNVEAISSVKKALKVPFIANGNVRSWQDACNLYNLTGADGIMAARGLLTNPSLFNPACIEHKTTCLSCMQQWLDISECSADNIQFQCFHHHLTFMWNNNLKRNERIEFNKLTNKLHVLQFIKQKYGLEPAQFSKNEAFNFTQCTYDHVQKPNYSTINQIALTNKWNGNSDGKFFTEFTSNTDENELAEQDDEIDLADSFLMASFN